jgi:L-alanine-DL-glutamate epimerase-like enolase superfamily enzyme
MSSSDYRDIVHLEYTRDGLTGRGEGAPIVRYHEDAASAQRAIDEVAPILASADPAAFRQTLDRVFRRMGDQWAAKAAIDLAVLDWVGQRRGLPLYGLLGLDPGAAPITTYSIGVDTPETTKKKVLEAAEFPVLKVKFGLGRDEATMEAIRSVTNKPIRADANEGYKTKEEALDRIHFLERHGVEFIEQPLPAERLDDLRWLRGKVNLPIFADEACLRAADLPKVAGAVDGVVVKLMKTGGVLGALHMIEMARTLGLKVMLGCMIESSVSITAAAHLSPLADYADLDGNLLISNDAWEGVRVERGRLRLPDRPGLGLRARPGLKPPSI